MDEAELKKLIIQEVRNEIHGIRESLQDALEWKLGPFQRVLIALEAKVSALEETRGKEFKVYEG